MFYRSLFIFALIGLCSLTLASTLAPKRAAAADTKAYVINEIHVTDPVTFKTYADQVPDTLKPFGGVFFVRGGNAELIDGGPAVDRIVIIEFPNRASAKAWHESAAYQKIHVIRQASSTSRVYIVDGLAP